MTRNEGEQSLKLRSESEQKIQQMAKNVSGCRGYQEASDNLSVVFQWRKKESSVISLSSLVTTGIIYIF